MDYSYTAATPAQSYVDPATAGLFLVFGLVLTAISLIVLVISIVGMWKVFTKAGKPGWASIIPIYNLVILCEIAGRPAWWAVLAIIPFVCFVWVILGIIIALDLAKAFGKSPAFGIIGLWLFSIVGYLILGFGKSQYQAPTGTVSGSQPLPPQTPIGPAAPAGA